MFSPQDMRQLSGLPLEKQVIEILLEHDVLMSRSDVQKQLVPRPSDAALLGLIARMCKRNDIAEYPSGDEIHAPLIGLPGWAITKPRYKPEAAPVARPIAVPAAPTPSMETHTMPKKRATRIKTEDAIAAIVAVLTPAGAPLEDVAAAADLPGKATQRVLGKLRIEKRAALIGRGKNALWASPGTPAAAQVPAPQVETRDAAIAARVATPRGNGHDANGRKFGYFSDGSVSIDCEECKGTLTVADLKAFRTFATRFEDATK